jgi:hypothetical protein
MRNSLCAARLGVQRCVHRAIWLGLVGGLALINPSDPYHLFLTFCTISVLCTLYSCTQYSVFCNPVLCMIFTGSGRLCVGWVYGWLGTDRARLGQLRR